MTEHTKIPVPGKGKGKLPGRSLFERAENRLGEGGYRPAPVPSELKPPVNRQRPERPARSAPVVEPATVQPPKVEIAPAPPVEDIAPPPPVRLPDPEPAPAIATPPVATAPVAQPLQAVAFTGAVQPIERELLDRHGLINPEATVTALLEEFRIVKRQVLKSARASGDAKARRVLVSSPLPNEGKTYCATNLALAMAAERDCEVVLVDADVAKPSLLSLLGLPRGPGLMDALANPDIAVKDCVIPTDIAGFHVLPAGHQTNADSEYLAAAHTAEVLDRLTAGAPGRILVFDSPPALAASPGADLAHHVGQTVMVVRADRTGQSALEDALTLLASCPDIKLLLNAANFSPSGRRFGSYYGQGR